MATDDDLGGKRPGGVTGAGRNPENTPALAKGAFSMARGTPNGHGCDDSYPWFAATFLPMLLVCLLAALTFYFALALV